LNAACRLFQPAEPRELNEAEFTRHVRIFIYANARKLIDWPAKYPQGRKMLREQLAEAKKRMREPSRYEFEDVLWAEWMAARITKALNANKCKGPASTAPVSREHLARIRQMADRIEHLTGMTAWDPYKQESAQVRAVDAREAWYLAGCIGKLAEGRRP